MPDLPISLFISYAHADSAFVDRLEADLQQQGFDPWVDRQQLAGGQRWRHELQEAVEHAQVLLIVLSPDAIASLNVQIEFGYALELSKLLIPVYYRQCNVPMELRAIQWIDFRHSYEQGLAALLQALRHQPKGATPVQSPSSLQTEPVSASPHVPGEAERKPASNLPVQLTPLIGRQRDRQAVGALLTQPEVRLVTLTGSAGIGKTRLAVQVAAELSEQFPDGVFLVALSPVSDPGQVVPAILQTLSISEMSGQTPLQRLKTVLHERQLLLLLDNFEQVVQAAVAVAELLSACAGLKVLVTSRMVLHLRGEHEYVVPPLSLPNPKRLPDLATLAQYEAVALFLQRTQAVKPEFELTAANASAVASICIQLDGLPLAIELAAAHSKYFPPHTLLARLEQGLSVLSGGARDLPARQQTLRGAIAWSYDLLESEEQQLLRRFSVFVDGGNWLAAKEVCSAASPLHTDILEGLLSLVDKSLLRQAEPMEGTGDEEGEPRFWMLQTLREFGLEVLASDGETEATRQAHAQYYLRLSEDAAPRLRGSEQARWFARLEQEHENLRSALSFLLEQAHGQAGIPQGPEPAERLLRLCAALHPFWHMRGYYLEGQAFLEQAVAVRAGANASVQAQVLFAAAHMAFLVDDLERAEVLGGEGLSLYRELGDHAGLANCLGLLGSVARGRGQYRLAADRLEEATALFRDQGNSTEGTSTLREWARVATEQGRYAQAQALLDESKALSQALGDKSRVAWTRYLQARLLFLSQQDPEQAQRLVEQSLAQFEQLGIHWMRAFALSLLGQMYLARGEWAQARARLEESAVFQQEIGSWGDSSEPVLGLARVALGQQELAEARRRCQESLRLQVALGSQALVPACLEVMGILLATQGRAPGAVEYWGTAEALREELDTPLHPVECADYERAVAAARRELGEEAFATAWAQGRTTPVDQVITDVLTMEER